MQRFGEIVLVELVNTGKVDCRDGRTFLYFHNDHVTLRLDLNVVEEAGCIERTNGFRRFVVREDVTSLERDIGEDRAGLDTLQAVDLYVLDDKAAGRRINGRSQEHVQCDGNG